MAKELPYYKHEPSEWLEGEIQICSDEAIVCFINLCSGYWLKLGCISYAFALQKYCRRDANILQELIDTGMVDKNEDNIYIKFLDKQLSEFNNVSQKRSKAAQKRWSDANALQVHSKSNAIREEKIREKNMFIAPTFLQVAEYCNERKNNVDVNKFIDFYDSKGWMVGKNKMKDWKACIRTWEKSSTELTKQPLSIDPLVQRAKKLQEQYGIK
jgi:hypothetical protein